MRDVDINQMFPLPSSEDLRPLDERRFCFGVQTSLDVGGIRAPDSIDGMDIFVIVVVGIILPPRIIHLLNSWNFCRRFNLIFIT